MLTLQQVGTEILTNNPSKFYVFCGSEIGIKQKYISLIEQHYDGRHVECQSVKDVLDSMKVKQIIPKQPTLYVIRYDETFISSLSEKTDSIIRSCNIVGSVVCIYELDKHVSKLVKYIPDFCVSIDAVDFNFLKKYASNDFILPDRLIDAVCRRAENYSQVYNMCSALSALPTQYLSNYDELVNIVSQSISASTEQIKLGIASRNYQYTRNVVDNFDGDNDEILYSALSCAIELDKIAGVKYSKSPYSQYIGRWNRSDIYNLFCNAYSLLKAVRSGAGDSKYAVDYLLSLISFERIPSYEEISC